MSSFLFLCTCTYIYDISSPRLGDDRSTGREDVRPVAAAAGVDSEEVVAVALAGREAAETGSVSEAALQPNVHLEKD